MANGTVSLKALPDALRIKSRNDFVVSVVQSWAKGEGLMDRGIAADIAKAQIDEFVGQMQAFHEQHFPREDMRHDDGGDGNVTAWPGQASA